LANLAWAWDLRGQPERAARLMGAGEGLSDSWGVKLQLDEQENYYRNMARVRAQLGDEAFEALRVEGRAMKLDEVIEYALSE